MEHKQKGRGFRTLFLSFLFFLVGSFLFFWSCIEEYVSCYSKQQVNQNVFGAADRTKGESAFASSSVCLSVNVIILLLLIITSRSNGVEETPKLSSQKYYSFCTSEASINQSPHTPPPIGPIPATTSICIFICISHTSHELPASASSFGFKSMCHVSSISCHLAVKTW